MADRHTAVLLVLQIWAPLLFSCLADLSHWGDAVQAWWQKGIARAVRELPPAVLSHNSLVYQSHGCVAGLVANSTARAVPELAELQGLFEGSVLL